MCWKKKNRTKQPEFHSKKIIIYMETKKTQNSQSELKKEEKSWRNQSVSTTSDYTDYTTKV